MPAGLIVNSIICLLLGLAGLLGAVGNGIALLATDQIAAVMPAEARENYVTAMELQRIPILLGFVFGLVPSLLMICGSSGSLLKKHWGRKIFSWGLIGFVAWGTLMMASTIFTLLFNAEQMISLNSDQFGEAAATQMFYIGQVVGIAMMAAFIGYYFFVFLYLKRDNVDAFFAQLPN
jgi:hypothetical protein